MKKLTCFKAYDIRGKLGIELNNDIAYRIGRAYAEYLKPATVVVGGDIRLTSDELKRSLAEGLMDSGVDVIDLGMTGTEEVYFATSYLKADGGIEVTASHNPLDFNGMKLIRENSKPISSDTGLKEIQQLAEMNIFPEASKKGHIKDHSCLDGYIQHLMTYIDVKNLKPKKIVVNAGNGAAGHVIDALDAEFQKLNIPIEFIRLHHQPDGSFPNGIPNPLLPGNRADTTTAVIKNKADMGVAWDGDFDRCFLFDENGVFIEGYYIVGLLAEAFLKNKPDSKILHDPRLTWNTIDIVTSAGGIPVQCKTGHAFIKERMREEDAIYGGEMSAHHYFKDFFYCDSGMIPFLLVTELLCIKNKILSSLVDARMQLYPCSGEINFKVENVEKSIDDVKKYYLDSSDLKTIDSIDGLSMEFSTWRFNLRGSNTEPVLRLNIESRENSQQVKKSLEEIKKII